jgi:hypothetical protein
MPDITEYVRFYTDLQKLERRLRRTTDLGIRLAVAPQVTGKMEEACRTIAEHINEKMGLDSFNPPAP